MGVNEGKKICEKTREVRKKFAEYNGIEYEFTECDYEGPCSGTCLLCEVELAELLALAEEKAERENMEIGYPMEMIQEEVIYDDELEIAIKKHKFPEPQKVLIGMMKLQMGDEGIK